MARRKTRNTERRRQDRRALRVRGVRHTSPDARKLSRALIGLAVARAEADAQQHTTTTLDRGNPAMDVNGDGDSEGGNVAD